MSEQMRVHVFSNGDAYRTWLHNNCARCVKVSDCSLEYALASACVLDGTISPDVAARLGVPADGNERWWCNERQVEGAAPPPSVAVTDTGQLPLFEGVAAKPEQTTRYPK